MRVSTRKLPEFYTKKNNLIQIFVFFQNGKRIVSHGQSLTSASRIQKVEAQGEWTIQWQKATLKAAECQVNARLYHKAAEACGLILLEHCARIATDGENFANARPAR